MRPTLTLISMLLFIKQTPLLVKEFIMNHVLAEIRQRRNGECKIFLTFPFE